MKKITLYFIINALNAFLAMILLILNITVIIFLYIWNDIVNNIILIICSLIPLLLYTSFFLKKLNTS